jgi:hypothetical protein
LVPLALVALLGSAPARADYANPCSAAPTDGAYCGQSRQWEGGRRNVLYECEGGRVAREKFCVQGCFLAPAGQPDRCNDDPAVAAPAPVVVVEEEEPAGHHPRARRESPPPEEPKSKVENDFHIEVRAIGFWNSGFRGKDATGAVSGGVQLGGSTWFRPWIGMLWIGGGDAGYLFARKDASFTIEGELGPQLSPASDHWIAFQFLWAPKVFISVVKSTKVMAGMLQAPTYGPGEVASPAGFEFAMQMGIIKIPFWVLETLDGSTVLGAGLGLATGP